VVAAVAYALPAMGITPWINLAYGNLAYVGAAAWLPWLLLGADMAVRGRGRRVPAGWLVAGFAASQALSTWLGQGAYYCLAATAAYVVFLTLLGAPAAGRGFRARLGTLALHAAGLGACALALSAWSLFPRLEFLLVSNLRGGYGEGQQQLAGGASPWVFRLFFEWRVAYAGGVVVLLLLATALRRPTRERAFYLVMTGLAYAASTIHASEAAGSSPAARTAFGLVPGLLQLHTHQPERVLFVAIFFAAVLAGSGLDPLLRARGRSRLSLAAAGTVGLLTIWVFTQPPVPGVYWLFALAAAVAALVVVLAWRGWMRPGVAGAALAVLACAEIAGSALSAFSGPNHRVLRLGDPVSEYAPLASPRHLRLLRASSGEARFFGYDARTVVIETGYRDLWEFPVTRELLVTTQATPLGLQDIQGYNPVHLTTYDRLLTVAGGRPQNYRSAYVLPAAADSPLLDMLGARHVLSTGPADLPSKYARVPGLERPVLYRNAAALPRAWIVHAARATDDTTALRLIDSGRVDPRATALLREPPPPLSRSVGPERLEIRTYEPDRIVAEARLSAPGLVVLGEMDYPAWRVRVDGAERPVLRANGALRAVRVEPGQHTIEWYYDSVPSRVGFVLSAAASVLLLGILVLWSRLRRNGREGRRDPDVR
jgi:hypothetical protein